jgi:hypothetical protein
MTTRELRRKQLSAEERRRGYYALADRMKTNDNDLAIFRDFGEANFLVLMRLQSEITLLEAKLEDQRLSDDQNIGYKDTSTTSTKTQSIPNHDQIRIGSFSSSFYDMRRAAMANGEENIRQFKLLNLLEEKLIRYSSFCLPISGSDRMD